MEPNTTPSPTPHTLCKGLIEGSGAYWASFWVGSCVWLGAVLGSISCGGLGHSL